MGQGSQKQSKMSVGLNVCGGKSPRDDMSVGEMSVRRNICGTTYPWVETSWGKLSWGEMFIGRVAMGELSGLPLPHPIQSACITVYKQ
jgi:hypothetical protein